MHITSDTESEAEEQPLKTYPRRWIVLAIASFAISLRGYNQSCYGPINNVYSKYFGVEPWQVDWLIVVQSVVFLVISLPMTLLTTRIGYRLSALLITATLTLGFILTAIGVNWRNGFAVVLSGQAIMGFSNIVSWSIPPATAAIWFPSNEVATAVAIQVVGRGVGEAFGSFLPTVILDEQSTVKEMKTSLLYMFAGLSSIAFLLTLASIFIVKNAPPTPPSVAQAKIIRSQQIREGRDDKKSLCVSIKEFAYVVKSLFKNKVFIAVWFVFGAVNPILRNNNVLLTSVLHHRFTSATKINMTSGIVLLVAWSMYTLGGFIAGPLITKTKRYKEIVLASIVLMFLSCSVIMAGVRLRNLDTIYAGVMAQGLFIGIANTSLFELLAEVTYPHPPMFVTMIAIVILGMFRLTFPLVGRLMLNELGPTWSTTLPVAMTAVCSLIILFIKPEYKRERANRQNEYKSLIDADDGL